ncbi:MAG TPA: DUF1015 domain-containing protein [Burkholderiaceae bacterium]|nr:DUF1015 domain-containing protein [Burkholderiaceae bacterium]
MGAHTGFRLPRSFLPRPGIDLKKWAVVACDQYTSEPEYWRKVADEVGDAPSTLHLIFPEAYLGSADAPARIRRIQESMRRYLAEGVLVEHAGAIYVERTIGGRVRRGLMVELDLEHYDFSSGTTSLIRPTEGTMVARLAPRIEVRNGAELELPHVLVLIDDPGRTVIEPFGAARPTLTKLYETDLMLGGGHVAGYAVDGAQSDRAVDALEALADPRRFAKKYGVPVGTPVMLFAMGDGNHSLATAKSIWDRVKGTVGMDHPSRYALVEVENIHDPALEFAPIHRLLLGVAADVRQALAAAFGPKLSCTDVASAAAMRARVGAVPPSRHAAGLIGPGPHFSVVEIADPPSTLAIGTLQPFIDRFIERGGAADIDYIHGDDVLERLATNAGSVGIHFAAMSKSDLLRMVVREGPLPRKTFSMGEANEKRFYLEARRIRTAQDAATNR